MTKEKNLWSFLILYEKNLKAIKFIIKLNYI